MANEVSIEVLDGSTYAARDVPVPLTQSGDACRLRIQSVTGARATQVPVREGQAVVFRVEIPCEGEESILLDLRRDPQRGLVAEAVGKPFVVLPPHDRYAPAPPLRPSDGPALDLCFLVDGTALTIVDDAESRRFALLLGTRASWERHVAALGAFAERLRAAYSDLRVSALSFGDGEIEDVGADDLKPTYPIFPPQPSARRLRARTASQVRAALLELPPTPGADFVDGLGDALRACDGIGWRPSARKILMLTGDSPGFSIRNPAPPYADWHVRRHDVDEAAEQLHERGVEIVTIYHRAADPTQYGIADPSAFVHFAAEQYARLASHPGSVYELDSYDGEAAASAICSDRRALARESSLGILQGAPPAAATR